MIPILVPAEVLKCRAQVMKNKKMNYREELREIIKGEGYRGLYRGVTICFLREFPGCGIFFYIRYKMEQILKVKEEKNRKIEIGKRVLSGGIAGMISWTFGMPVDAVKSLILVQRGEQLTIR